MALQTQKERGSLIYIDGETDGLIRYQSTAKQAALGITHPLDEKLNDLWKTSGMQAVTSKIWDSWSTPYQYVNRLRGFKRHQNIIML